MMDQNMTEDLTALEAKGWEVDTEPRGLSKLECYPSFDAAVSRLVGLGDKAAACGVVPSIHIENGTEVTLRIGRPYSPGLTPEEIELAKSLESGQ